MRTLLLSDIHSNLPALEAVLADAEGEFDAAWVLGDTVGYGADLSACVAIVRDLDALAIAGNHEMAAIGNMTAEHFNPVARRAIEWTASVLSEDEREYLLGLQLVETAGRFTLVHGSPSDPVWEYLTTPYQLLVNLEHFETTACAVGHSHQPFNIGVSDGKAEQVKHTPGERERLIGDRLYVNPGSVGQPRDRDKRASFALLDQQAWDIEFRRVEYDTPRAQARIREKRLPDFFADRLALGQ